MWSLWFSTTSLPVIVYLTAVAAEINMHVSARPGLARLLRLCLLTRYNEQDESQYFGCGLVRQTSLFDIGCAL